MRVVNGQVLRMERRTYLRTFANGDTQKLILIGEEQEPVRNYRGDLAGYNYFYRFRTPSGNEIRLSLQAVGALTPCEAGQ